MLQRMKIWLQSRFFAAAGSLSIAAGASAMEDTVDFVRDIRPLFKDKCVSCHGGVKRASGLSFLSREGVLAKGKSGKVPVRPGDPASSEMIRRVTSSDPDERMPPVAHGPAL